MDFSDMNKKTTLLFTLLLGMTSIAFAEVYKCDGVWTNKPCTVTPTPQTNTALPSPSPQQDRDETFFERRKLFTDADLEAFRARRDGKGNVSLDEARDVCLAPRAELSLCRSLVTAIMEKIQALPTKQSTPANTPVIDQSNNRTEITIINENTDIDIHKHDSNHDRSGGERFDHRIDHEHRAPTPTPRIPKTPSGQGALPPIR